MTPVTRRYWVYAALFAACWLGFYINACLEELGRRTFR